MAVYKSKKPTKDGRLYFFRIKYKDILGVSHDYTSPKFKSPREAKDEKAIYGIKVNNQEAFTSTITFGQAYKELKLTKNKKVNDINVQMYNSFISILEKESLSAGYKNKIIGLFSQVIKYSSKYYNTSEAILKYVENFKEVGEIKKEMDFLLMKNISNLIII